MPIPEPIPASTGLKHLEGLSFEGILAWLERALRGKEALPLTVPGESPEDPILRRERELKEIARKDLRDACRVLIRRFAKAPENDDDYVNSLLRLAKGLNLSDVAEVLFELARQPELFAALPGPQRKSVLFTLFDLRAALPQSFWKDLAALHPASLGVIAFSGLLRQGAEAALSLLPEFPNDEAIADSIYIALRQHARLLNAEELRRLATAANQTAEICPEILKEALKEWTQEAVPPGEAPGAVDNTYSRLDAALASRATRKNTTFVKTPASARLLESKAA